MARIKLDINGPLIFKARICVRISDINYGNHVGNDAFVSMIHEARMQWLNTKDFSELDIQGTGLIMSDLVLEFKQEAFYGEHLEVEVIKGEVSKVSFELYYVIYTTRPRGRELLCKAKTGMVCYNYAQKKVSAIPPALTELLETVL